MKLKLLYIFALAGILASCNSTYYQIYDTETGENIKTTTDALVYEDDFCRISYNFWKEGGSAGFEVYNKTEENLHLYLDESYFILNGIAHDYFQDRVFMSSAGTASAVKRSKNKASLSGMSIFNLWQTDSKSLKAESAVSLASGVAVSYKEQEVISIPAKTAKIINEFDINNQLFRDCDLIKYPNKRQVKTINFSKNNSPVIFSNRLAYTVGGDKDLKQIENEFYISAITNYPEKKILDTEAKEFCGDKGHTKIKYFKESSPDSFYIQYTKTNGDPFKY